MNVQGSAFSVERSITPYFVRLAPWLLLALLFYIPGVYLEWPSDPWEHLRRINEWRILDTVGAHSSWMKSAYFIPYSMLSWCIGLRQLFWLDFYYTGICLLLCWQYYRFSRACGLGERASMVFVIIQTLLFGNNIFSFYRYYGISTSIYAQLGAIALTRIVLEWAAWRTDISPLSELQYPSGSSLLATGYSTSSRPSFWHLASGIRLLASGFWLIALTAFNHPQGIGIAGLGIAAVIAWRLIEWKRSALWWLIGGTIAINALFLWLYPRPPIIETYRAQGYLNAWYGFNIFDLKSLGGDRLLQIVTVFGLLNAGAAIWLIRYRNVIVWLTLIPFVALASPFVSIPLASHLSNIAEHYVVTFQRMLLSVPPFLAITAMLNITLAHRDPSRSTRIRAVRSTVITLLSAGSIAAVCCTPASSYTYNRFWHTVERTASDLELRSSISDYSSSIASLSYDRIGWTRIGTAATVAGDPIQSTGEARLFTLPSTMFVSRSLKNFGMNENVAQDLTKAISTAKKLKDGRSQSQDGIPLIKWCKSTPSDWKPQRFAPPHFSADTSAPGRGAFIIENTKGLCTWIFSASMFPVSPLDTYQVAMSIRRKEGGISTAFFAVAWYDKSGAFLDSGVAVPAGAGAPQGWYNGIFSYFGASGNPAPSQWVEYSAAFGLGYVRAIPTNAASMRVGAILNANEAKNAVVQLCNVNLYRIVPPTIATIPSQIVSNHTPRSLAGLLSGHWSAFQVSTDGAGLKELREVSKRFETIRSQPIKSMPLNSPLPSK